MADIAAISLIKGLLNKLPTLMVQRDMKLSDIKHYNERATSFVGESNGCFVKIAEYIGEILRHIEGFKKELKNHMIKQTDIMKSLLQRITDLNGM